MPAPGYEIGSKNRDMVRRFFETHLCATNRECAAAIGLSVEAVGRHVAAIRSEWKDAEKESDLALAFNRDIGCKMRKALIDMGWAPPEVVGRFKAVFRVNMLRRAQPGENIDAEIDRALDENTQESKVAELGIFRWAADEILRFELALHQIAGHGNITGERARKIANEALGEKADRA